MMQAATVMPRMHACRSESWVRNVRLWMLRVSLALAGVLCLQNAAFGTTYYVRKSGSDFSDGESPDQAVRTIGRGVELAGAGDTVYVGAGTYAEKVKIEKSGTSGSYISFVADTKGQKTGDAGNVVVSGSGSEKTGFELKKSGYVRIKGFTITDSKDYGIKAKDADRVIIEDCRISGNKKGIDLKGWSCTIAGCTVYNNRDRGIKVHGKDAGSVISGCVVYGNGKDGIEIKPGKAVEGDDDDDDAGDDDDDDDDGGSDSDEPCKAVVQSCIVYGNGKTGIKVSGKKTDVALYNNTIALNGKEGVNVKRDGTTRLINNIIAYNAKEGLKKSKGTALSDYNLFWQNGKGDYKGVSAGQHDLADDPLFKDVAAFDFHLTANSPARGAGLVTGAPSTDFEGQPRGTDGLVDIGADEYGVPIRVLNWTELIR